MDCVASPKPRAIVCWWGGRVKVRGGVGSDPWPGVPWTVKRNGWRKFEAIPETVNGCGRAGFRVREGCKRDVPATSKRARRAVPLRVRWRRAWRTALLFGSVRCARWCDLRPRCWRGRSCWCGLSSGLGIRRGSTCLGACCRRGRDHRGRDLRRLRFGRWSSSSRRRSRSQRGKC